MAESEEELKSLLIKVKVEGDKVGLKLNIQKTKINGFWSLTSWQIDGETVETVADLLFWAPRLLQMVTAAMKLKDTCSLEEKFRQNVKKLRHHFASNGLCSQSYDFSSSHVRMWELDHKKAGWQKIDSFKLWCWGRLLRVAWTARSSNQPILKEINPEHSLEGLMLKLQWCKEPTHWKIPWC